MSNRKKLIENILAEKLITTEQLEQFENEASAENVSIEDILVGRKILSKEKIIERIARLSNMPYISLLERDIDEGVLNTISSEVAENYRIICFDKEATKIKVGLLDPENFKAVEAIDFLAKGSGLAVEYYLISEDSYRSAFKQYKSLAKELSSALQTRAEEENLIEVGKGNEGDLEEVTKSAPVAKIVSVIIRHAVEGGASDIHIEPMRKETRVRYRIDGVLHTSLVLPLSVHPAIVARIKVMAYLKLDETRIPQDGRIKLIINDKEIDFRVSILPLIGAEKVVMRILDTTKGAPKLEELGYQGGQLKIILNNIKKTEGLLLVTGPTGSGKSTTLFAVLNMLNKEGVNISTLEDPVEYQIKGVNQSQIRPEVGYTFSAGLRSFLRQDPDVIMVGEIRDEETAELAIHAALTGHTVLSTLHTTDAPGAISRFVDMGIAPFLLGSTLHTVIAQRLARKICDKCKEKTEIPADYKKDVEKELEIIGEDYIKEIMPDFNKNELNFYKGKGCPHCGNSGYQGRVAVSEVLDVNKKLKELIFNGETHLSLEVIKTSQDFITVYQDGVIKVIQGLTTMEEVLRVMKN